MEFDPQVPSFAGATAEVNWQAFGVSWQTVWTLEPGALGFGIALTSPQGNPVEKISLRWNLERYVDRPQGQTFSFSYGAVKLSWPSLCCGEIPLEVEFGKGGFEEISARLELGELCCGVSLGTALRWRPGRAEVRVSPSLVHATPAGLDLYLGLEWTAARWDGLKIYAIGFRWEEGLWRLRWIHSLAEDELNLVKDPYWEVFGISAKLPGCCGEGEASAAFYFGEEGLFSVSELAVEVSFPVAPSLTVGLGLSLPRTGPPTLTLSWSGS